ncbi:RNA-binding transcriptional accessory protein [Anaerococcus vaginalis]|uniref:Tex-like protein N-terminal domain protein n=3 Tax=Anaerococcus vaginalis TaxID=33037 RepID=C7HUP8_9FIRM|nr:Tex family protein [Anaerococcus vaginalis]EEU12554.1 Tex-like protein N-terminal domain protein [Anaerococcus vaginalis ATCC 51170]QQB61369.1 RNA-binding transcriptional accessory protein [Anaerococcus vaginalis]
MEISKILSDELNINQKSIDEVIKLLDEGSTVAFIARYRKEKTGGLKDTEIRDIESGLTRLRNFEKRKEEILTSLENQEKLDDELKEKIEKAKTLTELEDIYAPFKKKRKTRADKAKELGLMELLDEILMNATSEEEGLELAKKYIKEGVEDEVDAINKSLDILAEDVANNIEAKNIIRRDGLVRARILAEKKEDEDLIYENYYDFDEKIKNLKPFQILALNRAEKNNDLTVKLEFTDNYNLTLIKNLYKSNNDYTESLIRKAIEDSYKRLLIPTITTEIKNKLTENAENESIKVFSKNLKPYILQRPIKDKNIIGLDPGFRTGCKVAVIDKHGKYLDQAVIYPVKPHSKEKESIEILKNLISKYDVDIIALGNATASRETEIVVNKLLKEVDGVSYAIVNEAGASVYSASKLGEEEFPNLDVTIRGAVSMARRLQDPMAELVKIDPKHLGVGQYQHDINQKKLDDELSKVVEDSVNEVGVNINNASYKLLSYVSGLNLNLAKRIEEDFKNGAIKERKDLKKVKGLGDKTYKMAAGFLRFPDSSNFLDNTAVHPESYVIAKKLVDYNLDEIDLEKCADELEVGVLTLKDIIEELKKPGRDPRDELPEVVTKSEILSIDDLNEGDILEGTVRNITEFGCFVDIGVGIDGLVHISNMSDKFIKDPNEIVTNSDIIKVKVIEIDKKRERIGLSMKNLKEK